MHVFFHYGYLIILFFHLVQWFFFYYYNRTLLHIIKCGGSTLARQEELKFTSSKTRPPKRLDDCTYKNASGSMTYIRDRRRLVPTRASLMNSPIKFDQLNLSWPLFPLSLSLSLTPSPFLLYFFLSSFLCVFIFFLFSCTFSYFFLYYFCVCMTDFYPIDTAHVYPYIILHVYICLWLGICLYCYQLESVG